MRHTCPDFFEIGNLSKINAATTVANVIQHRSAASQWTTNQVSCATRTPVIDASMVVETLNDQEVTWHCGEKVQSLYRALLGV